MSILSIYLCLKTNNIILIYVKFLLHSNLLLMKIKLISFLLITSCYVKAQCPYKWGDQQEALNYKGINVYFWVQYSNCNKSNGICGFPKIDLQHNHSGIASIQLRLRGIDCNGILSTGTYNANDLISMQRLHSQGNWHTFKEIKEIVSVVLNFKEGEDLYTVTVDYDKKTTIATKNGSKILANGKTQKEIENEKEKLNKKSEEQKKELLQQKEKLAQKKEILKTNNEQYLSKQNYTSKNNNNSTNNSSQLNDNLRKIEETNKEIVNTITDGAVSILSDYQAMQQKKAQQETISQIKEETERQRKKEEDNKKQADLEYHLKQNEIAQQQIKIEQQENILYWKSKSDVIFTGLSIIKPFKKLIDITNNSINTIYYINWQLTCNNEFVIFKPIEVKKSPDGDWPTLPDLKNKLQSLTQIRFDITPNKIPTTFNELNYLIGYFENIQEAEKTYNELIESAIYNGYIIVVKDIKSEEKKIESQSKKTDKSFWEE